MHSKLTASPLCYLPLALLFSAAAPAQSFAPVTYELSEGSVLIDDCTCDRVPIERPIRGTMVLTRLPVRIVGEMYEITAIDFATVSTGPVVDDFQYAVKGTGRYYRNGAELSKHSLDLEVEINGVSGVQLASDLIDGGGAFPAIDIAAGEKSDPPRDPLHIYSLRLVAAPKIDDVLYELVVGDTADFEGSFFIDDCTICGRPTIPVPVAGSFRLSRVGVDGADPFRTYAIKELQIENARAGLDYRITGAGTYIWGGEVALLQGMDLAVTVNEDAGVLLSSKLVPFPAGTVFPDIEIDLAHENPKSPIHVYSLKLVARPAASQLPRFRRGDSNGDGRTDISDAVHVLLWRFAGGEEPSCLDAADTDGDGEHAITDGVFLLEYLFLNGPRPPAPGPFICGAAPKPVFGCGSQPACGG